jgi:predicted phosphohydrolase
MTGIEGEISVNFVIQGQHSKPSVHYGHTAADLDHVADAVERIDHDYDRLHYTIWTAIITAPALDLVFYRAFNGGDGTMLHRLRVPSSRAHNATLAICGDIGLKWSAPIVSEALKHDNTLDLMIQPGDISYATTIEGMNTFLDRMQSLASRVPYLTMLGNHESDRKEVLTAYQARFPNDILAQNSHAPDGRYYSFDAYGIHFAILDSMQNLGSSSAQYQWLEKDLMAAAERRRVDPKAFPWIIVSYHYPMYSSHNRKGDTGKQAQLKCMQESLEALFMLYKVDIAITGHDHVYERSVPLYQGKQNAEGIVHLTVGTGGHNIYSSWDPQPAYTGTCAWDVHVCIPCSSYSKRV